MSVTLKVYLERFDLARVFRISRGAKTSAEVVTLVLCDGEHAGWGEAVPYGRYGETLDSVSQSLWELQGQISSMASVQQVLAKLPAGSARNALDCALWDLKAKQQQISVAEMLALPQADSVITAQTLSIDTPQNMAAAATELTTAPLIKIKLDAEQIVERIAAVHEVCPHSKFIVDANEAWNLRLLESVTESLAGMNVALIEQPLPAGEDNGLIDIESAVPLCADESCHTSDNLEWLADRYQAVNIKLDKTGGLSEAVALAKKAKSLNLQIMLGCMVGSSLAMAPSYLLGGMADYVDLDGPLLVAQDREQGFKFDNGTMLTHPSLLWGVPQPADALTRYR